MTFKSSRIYTTFLSVHWVMARCRHSRNWKLHKLGNRRTDDNCHNYYQTFWPNGGPSSGVDQSTGHGYIYTLTMGGGARWENMVGKKGVGGNIGGCVGS